MKPALRSSVGRLATVVLSLCLPGCGADPRGILEEVGRAYRAAATYSDDGRVVVRLTRGGDATERVLPFRVAFSRPDRVRIEAYDARIVADGTTFLGAVGAVPGQVLAEPVTTPLTLDQLFAEDELRSTLTEGEAGCPTQLPLLLADDTVELILADATSPPRISGRGEIDGQPCVRVEIPKADGILELWIDPAAKLLRRMKVPTDAYAAELTRQAAAPVGVSVVVDFANASFAAPIPAEAFAFEVPADARRVSRLEPLVPPQPVHPLVGTKAEVPPLEAVAGPPVTRESLAGAPAVLEFFFAGCGPSSHTMPQVASGIAEFVAAHARRHGGERPTVHHLAVSIDAADVTVDALRKQLAEFGGVGTLVRDPQAVAARALAIESFPAAVVIAADGTVADVLIGRHGGIAADVAEVLAATADGKPTVTLVRARYARRLGDYRRDLARAAGAGPGGRLSERVIVPRRQPVRFKLERAWRASGVMLPGNVVCLDGARGADPTRVVALDGWRTVVELDATGREQGRYELALPRDDGVGFLRTTLDGSGRRWWLAGRRGGQRVFVFDAEWRLKAAYPGSGGAGPEGIGAAELADLDGDGTPEIILGHRGTGGVETVTLEGGTLWGDRSLGSVVGLAIGPPGEAVERTVLCVCTGGRLVAAERGREQAPDVTPPVPLTAVFSGPVAPDHAWAVLGLAARESAKPFALGIDPAALSTDWQLPLPEGPRRDGPFEPVCWADLLGTTRRQWLIAAADGSVTVAWADGRVVDRYQHGRPLTGIGGYRDGDTGHVVIATKDALEAYRLADIALD